MLMVARLAVPPGIPMWQPVLGVVLVLLMTLFCVYAAGRIYFFNDTGDSPVIEPGTKFRELAVNTLDEGCMASPAVAGNAIFLRTKTHLYKIVSGK